MSTRPFLPPLEHREGDVMLRAYRPGDGEALRESIVSSYEHLRPWIPWATQELTPREAEAKVRKWCAEYLENTAFRVGIWVEGRHVGGTGFLLRGKDISEGNGEIGMWLAAEQSGKGFGTIVLEMVLRWGFSDEWPCWQRLFWCTDAKNVGSARVAEKGGMKNEGTHRGEVLDVEGKRADLMVFALLREDAKRRISTELKMVFHHQGMKTADASASLLLRAAAAVNLLGAIGFALQSRRSVPRPASTYPADLAASMIATFGLGYLLASLDLPRFWPLAALGVFGKAFAAAVMLAHAVRGKEGISAAASAAIDGTFAALMYRMLQRHAL